MWEARHLDLSFDQDMDAAGLADLDPWLSCVVLAAAVAR
jgi:hypothetical protein